MQELTPSRTAMRVAMRRAAHQLFDSPLVLEDPLAVPILGARAEDELRASAGSAHDRLSRAMRAFIVVRSRVAEDAVAAAITRGVAQYVILGAGLDTFAYRNPFAALRVFEVDHPATQAWKRAKLADARIRIPESVTFAPIDFERQTLTDGLVSAGFQRDQPTFFAWLGVTMYLTPAAIDATLAFVQSTPPGGGLVFDYGVLRSSLGWMERRALDALSQRVAAAGEPFQTFFDPVDLSARLRRDGFSGVTDLDAAALNARYFSQSRGLNVSGGLGRIMLAQI